MKNNILSRVGGIAIICILLFGLAFAMRSNTVKDSREKEQGSEQVTQKQDKLVEMEDLTQVYEDILSRGTKDFYQGHAVDKPFLMWLTAEYGADTVRSLAERMASAKEDGPDSGLWYEATGKTMHTLWTEYCMNYGYSSYQTEAVTVLECQSKDRVTLDFVGDINLDSSWCTMESLSRKENGIKDCVSEKLLSELNNSDMAIANNEFTFSERGKAVEGKEYTFRADPKNVSLMKELGIDMAILANNHTFDYGQTALIDTVQTLEGAGILTSGAGEDIRRASLIHYVIANGRKIAFVSATEVEKYSNYTQEAAENTPGVLKMLNPELFLSVISEADANSDYVIAYVHWGQEGQCDFSPSQHNLAARIVDAGADAVIGSHTHRLQGVEFIDGAPVVYSLGNFWFSTGNLFTAVAQLQIDEKGSLSLTMLPCVQKKLKTSIIPNKNKELKTRFYKYLADLSTRAACDTTGKIYNLNVEGQDVQEIFDKLNESGAEWYSSGQSYSSHASSFDLDGKSIDVIGNLR